MTTEPNYRGRAVWRVEVYLEREGGHWAWEPSQLLSLSRAQEEAERYEKMGYKARVAQDDSATAALKEKLVEVAVGGGR